MAGLRGSIIVCVVTFLLGALCAHWTADALTLWTAPLTDAHLASAGAYYAVLAKMPVWLSRTFGAIVVAGGTTLLWSLGDGRAGNIMFDGASIFLYGCALFVYLNSALPQMTAHFAPMPVPPLSAIKEGKFPAALREPTLSLASSHLVVSIALTGVLILQAARWWAEEKDLDVDELPEGKVAPAEPVQS